MSRRNDEQNSEIADPVTAGEKVGAAVVPVRGKPEAVLHPSPGQAPIDPDLDLADEANWPRAELQEASKNSHKMGVAASKLKPQAPGDTATKAQAELDKARESLAGLEKQRDTAQKRKGEIGAEREKIAHAALAKNDSKAKARLRDLSTETTRLNVELENFSAALASAARIVSDAEKVLERAQQLEQLGFAETMLERRLTLADTMQHHLDELSKNFDEYFRIGISLRDLTGAHVNDRADAFAFSNMLKAAFFGLRTFLGLDAPEAQFHGKTFRELALQLNSHHERRIAAVRAGKPVTQKPREADAA